MTLYIGIALGVVSYLATAVGGVGLLFGDYGTRLRFVGGALLFTALVFTIWGIDQVTENSPPCLQYKTQLMYNAATKTMLPAQFCVNQGVWK